jgi:hypothetical protein
MIAIIRACSRRNWDEIHVEVPHRLKKYGKKGIALGLQEQHAENSKTPLELILWCSDSEAKDVTGRSRDH